MLATAKEGAHGEGLEGVQRAKCPAGVGRGGGFGAGRAGGWSEASVELSEGSRGCRRVHALEIGRATGCINTK